MTLVSESQPSLSFSFKVYIDVRHKKLIIEQEVGKLIYSLFSCMCVYFEERLRFTTGNCLSTQREKNFSYNKI